VSTDAGYRILSTKDEAAERDVSAFSKSQLMQNGKQPSSEVDTFADGDCTGGLAYPSTLKMMPEDVNHFLNVKTAIERLKLQSRRRHSGKITAAEDTSDNGGDAEPSSNSECSSAFESGSGTADKLEGVVAEGGQTEEDDDDDDDDENDTEREEEEEEPDTFLVTNQISPLSAGSVPTLAGNVEERKGYKRGAFKRGQKNTSQETLNTTVTLAGEKNYAYMSRHDVVGRRPHTRSYETDTFNAACKENYNTLRAIKQDVVNATSPLVL
jgi:hypothetical protein